VTLQNVSAENLAELTAQAAKADEAWDRYVRAVAELENFRKRAARERTEAIQHANEGFIRKLLPVVDNFDMALAAAGPGATMESFRTGVAMINSQFRQALAEAGVEEVNAAGQVFDPNFHEAVSQLESAEVPEGHVLHQVRKGYRLHGRLLRPASVVVAKAPAA
jgi:molecular chaperone GrpE